MPTHECIKMYPTQSLTEVRARLAKRDDYRIVRSINRACGIEGKQWYRHDRVYHRWFLRQLYQEAHNRGLDVPAFWPRKG